MARQVTINFDVDGSEVEFHLSVPEAFSPNAMTSMVDAVCEMVLAETGERSRVTMEARWAAPWMRAETEGRDDDG